MRVRCPVCWGVWVRVPLGALVDLSCGGWLVDNRRLCARGGILVDTPDLGSGVPCGVWVRVPPGALAAGFLAFPLAVCVPLTLQWGHCEQ